MTILHATDFSEGADRAFAVALALARSRSADLALLHVLGPMFTLTEDLAAPSSLERIRAARQQWAEAELERRVAEAARAGVRARGLIRVGEPYAEILHAATDEKADLVVLGTAGRGAVGRLLLGSVADRVLRRARCPVVTVREEARSGLAAA